MHPAVPAGRMTAQAVRVVKMPWSQPNISSGSCRRTALGTALGWSGAGSKFTAARKAAMLKAILVVFILLLLVIVGGGVFFATGTAAPEPTQVEKVIPNDRFKN
ncbi:MAG: hypothetical protein KJ904_17955 [Alphaproteobacteria bacterium]|nr:hypothetical protein [Alphaproteobacteria bacterium]MBU0796741.1 hypothetical protein [Alphaproteobacteria bacterium]MBU0889043.1 hypothetical protein [Alphaproteobacteria bacterium]MBU1814063.1 hypothetical protein [Alphaproteobacteria bacterium]